MTDLAVKTSEGQPRPTQPDPVWGHLVAQYDVRTLADQYPTPGALAKALDLSTNQTPALDLIDSELVRLVNEPGGRLIISMPPQQGKSTRVSQIFPVWALIRDPDLPVIVASYGEQLAERNGETIRNLIQWNAPKLGIDIEHGSSAKKRWRLEGRKGGVLSAGIGSGMTGWASGLTIIDDPIKDRIEADSETYRERVWGWWRDVAQTRLAPGAPVVLVLTRWHTDDLAGRLLAAEDGHRWRVVNIPAQADHHPSKGETDPLGRKPGEYLQSARRERDPKNPSGAGRPMSDDDWEKIKVGVGSRTWNALYQGRPAPAEGGAFQRTWWKRWDQPPALVHGVIQSWDMTFKGTDHSDFVVGQVWAVDGPNMYLLDQARGRWSFVETVRQVELMRERWPQTTATLVEDKANGTAVIDLLSRRIPGLIPVQPQGGKEVRAAAVSPFVEAGNVWLPAGQRWADDLIEEAAAFPNSSHDDQVDALTQALTYMHLTQPAQRDFGTAFWDIG